MSRRKKVLLTLAIVLVVAVIIGGGTFATFNASTTNANNEFSSGTVVLSDTVGATTCFSTGAGTNTDTNTNSAGCAKVINVTVQKPGGAASSTNVVLKNEGSLSGDLSASIGACTTSDASGETYHGTGDLCGALVITLDGNAASFGGAGTITAPISMAAGVSRTVPVAVSLPVGAGNTMQGRTATFDISWTLTQN